MHPINEALVAHPHLLGAQRRLLEVVVQLLDLDQRLYEMVDGLPLPALLIAMDEALIPPSGVGHLYLTVQRVQGQYLKPAIRALLDILQKSDEELLSARLSA